MTLTINDTSIIAKLEIIAKNVEVNNLKQRMEKLDLMTKIFYLHTMDLQSEEGVAVGRVLFDREVVLMPLSSGENCVFVRNENGWTDASVLDEQDVRLFIMGPFNAQKKPAEYMKAVKNSVEFKATTELRNRRLKMVGYTALAGLVAYAGAAIYNRFN